MTKTTQFLILLATVLAFASASAQLYPNDNDLQDLVTTGPMADGTWGDQDHTQVIYFLIPKTETERFYLRIFDPGTEGKLDEANQEFDSETQFALFGKNCLVPGELDGDSSISEDAKTTGSLVHDRLFGTEPEYDSLWVNFNEQGFEPALGQEIDGYWLFKMVVQGTKGDDGNLYRFFISNSPDHNSVYSQRVTIFAFRLTFRIPEGSRSMLYPQLSPHTTHCEIHIFDHDQAGQVFVKSHCRRKEPFPPGQDNEWVVERLLIFKEERGNCLNLEIRSGAEQPNNNVEVFFVNEIGNRMRIYTTPFSHSSLLDLAPSFFGLQ